MTKDFSWLSRTQLLIGEEALQKLAASHVLIVGLGGVGVPFVREEALATVRRHAHVEAADTGEQVDEGEVGGGGPLGHGGDPRRGVLKGRGG